MYQNFLPFDWLRAIWRWLQVSVQSSLTFGVLSQERGEVSSNVTSLEQHNHNLPVANGGVAKSNSYSTEVIHSSIINSDIP